MSDDNDSSEEADGPLKILKAQQNKERKEMRGSFGINLEFLI